MDNPTASFQLLVDAVDVDIGYSDDDSDDDGDNDNDSKKVTITGNVHPSKAENDGMMLIVVRAEDDCRSRACQHRKRTRMPSI